MKKLTREQYKAFLDDPKYVVRKAFLYEKATHHVNLGKCAPRVALVIKKAEQE